MAAANDTETWVQPGSKTQSGTHYRLTGPESGRLVLTIHGIGNFSVCFDQLAASLASKGRRVLQYDLMGRGWSDPAPSKADYGAAGHVEQLWQLLKDLGLESQPMDIIAQSMGGALATLFLDAHPPQHEYRLALLAPAGLLENRLLRVARRMKCLHSCLGSILKGGQEGEWRKDFVKPEGEHFEVMMRMQRAQARNNPHSFNAFFESAMRFPIFDLQEEARRVGQQQMKALLIWGKLDQAVPMEPSLSRWRSFLPSAEVETWDEVAHGFFLEQPERTATRIATFLQADSP